MAVVSQVARVGSVIGGENVWILNQVSVGLEAYAKSNCAETKLGTSTLPWIVTCPLKNEFAAGEVISISGAACRRSRGRRGCPSGGRHCAAVSRKANKRR